MNADVSKAVFLSYASQDAEAAKRICDALRQAGVEVWFDQNELVGGDSWDQKIRGQVKTCTLFVPIISAATQARLEGYFRLEWKLAASRTHTMADAKPFLLPVLIDATRDDTAHVPEEFRAVQWTRLPGGETSEKFCARVKKLLGGEAVSPAETPFQAHRSEEKHGRRQATPLLKPWLVAAIVIAALAVGLWTQLRDHKNAPGPVATPAKVESPAGASAAPATEAQRLVVKARKILDEGDELNREIFFLAEDLVKRAIDLDPAEPSARAFYAELSFWMTWQGFDNSETRRDLMRRQAEQARSLAPDSTDVQIAVANVRIQFGQDLPGLERDLLVLAAREPKNWRVHRALGMTYRYLSRTDDAIASLRRARDLSNGLPLASADLANVLLRRGRFAEAETIIAQALAKGSSGRLLTFDVMIKTIWHGDRVGAAAAIAAWPDWLRLEDRGAFQAWRTWLWSDQPEKALAAAQRLSRDFLKDTFFTGPRAALTARAHERAGHADAARLDWRMVVQICDRELSSAPENIGAQYWKAWALARLGDTAAAQALCTQMEQRNLLATNNGFTGSNDVPALWATVGRTDLAIAELRARRPDDDRIAVTRKQLELDPAFEPLRADPSYQEVWAAAPAPEKTLATLTTPAVDDKSVAVLAFANLSDDKANEYFSDGISEELLNVLAKIPGLKVTARTSSFHFKGKDTPIPEIAKQLGVAYVVEGSVRKAGDKVRITAQLIKASDGFHVWSDTFTRDLKDIFAVQDEIAGLIAKNLELKMGMVAATRTVDPEAYRLYLEALPEIAARTNAGFDRAELLITRAIARDPSFVPAQAALAVVWSLRAVQHKEIDSRDTPVSRRIVAQAELALKMGPDSAEAQAACGYVYTVALRFAEGEPLLRRAIQLNPSYAPAYLWLGRNLLGRGYIEEAITAMKRAVEVDPLSHRTLDNLGFTLIDAGRNREALGYLDQALRIRPDSNQAMAVKAQALSRMGRRSEALALIDQVDPGLDNIDEYIIEVNARAGRRAKLEALLAATTKDNRIRFNLLAVMDRNEEALDVLDKAIIDWGFIDTFLFNPLLDHLRTHPRFVAKLTRDGLTEAHARAQAWRAAHPSEKPEVNK